eukprot:g37125.t1
MGITGKASICCASLIGLELNGLCSQFLRLRRVCSDEANFDKGASEIDRVPLILSYHPTSIHIQKIIRRHFRHIQQDATTRHIFPSLPLSAFRRDRSLRDSLVHTSITPNTSPQPYGTFPCN